MKPPVRGSVKPSPAVCIQCKGRLWCGPTCFILEKYKRHKDVTQKLVKDYFAGSSPPSVFVGWHGYPKVQLAPMAPPEITVEARLFDDPEKWFGLPSEQIAGYRERLIRSNKAVDVYAAANPDYRLAEIQELAMTSEPVDVEVHLRKAPVARLSFSDTTAPMGPSAELKQFKFTENPSVDQRIDYVVSDTDATATEGAMELYGSRVSVNALTKLLSAGLLGVKKRRKFVPTRWAITATDSNLSKELIDGKVKYFATVDAFELFHGSYLDNNFYIMLVPFPWCFEMLEVWMPGGAWALEATEPHIISDYEPYKGRKDYADEVTGAYYAARLGVAEHLVKRRRQAGVIIFREIGGGYQTPMGVWVIRETVRDALRQPPLSFGSFELAMAYLKERLSVPVEKYQAKSKLVDELLHQKRISEWF